MRSLARTSRVLSVAALAALVVPSSAGAAPATSAAKPLPALAPAEPDALTRALASGRVDGATYALERVGAMFARADVSARYGEIAPADPHAATLLFRDLAVRAHQLRGADRVRAEALLARPTQGSADRDGYGYTVEEEPPVCSPRVCVHYVASSSDAPPPTDSSPANGIPDQVDATAAVMDEVWALQVDAYGYRAPKSDLSSKDNGGDGRFDVYLANVGADDLYGFCTTDDPNGRPSAGYDFYDVSAYCVLDDDYASGQFGYPDPRDPLEVTAAHEFHHAVQYAYDWLEDGWIMEASSTWIEDEAYDDIDDNLLYLDESPLSQPEVPLDKNVAYEWYGAWIFLRFLSEYGGANDGGSTAPDPTIVRSIWRTLDGAPGGPDRYSTQGVASAIAGSEVAGGSWTMRLAFADFAVWNSVPSGFYDEGGSYDPAKTAASKTLTGSRRSFTSVAELDHLANRSVALRRGSSIADDAKLKVAIDGPGSASAPGASAVVVEDSGAVSFTAIRLDAEGRGTAKVAFGSNVKRVIVIATNASVRYRNCWSYDTRWSCGGGTPVDENLSFVVRATVA